MNPTYISTQFSKCAVFRICKKLIRDNVIVSVPPPIQHDTRLPTLCIHQVYENRITQTAI